MKFAIFLALPCLLLLVNFQTCLAAPTDENIIYKELIEKGLKLSNGETVKLPEPTMADGLPAAQQDAIIANLGKPVGAVKFANGMATDPMAVKFEVNKPANPQPKSSIGRKIELDFVARGKFAWVANPNFIKQQLNNPNKKIDFYTAKELSARNLKIIDTPDVKERYVHALAELIELVVISASVRGFETIEKDSLIVAFKIDPRLEDDQTYPNFWQPVIRGNGGVRQLGPKSPYNEMAAYAKITRLESAPDRVFVEYHVVYDEPYGWFAGGDQLRAKLPNEYEGDVRKFRRDLTTFGKNAGVPAAAGGVPAAGGGVPAAGGGAPAAGAAPAKTDDKKKPAETTTANTKPTDAKPADTKAANDNKPATTDEKKPADKPQPAKK